MSETSTTQTTKTDAMSDKSTNSQPTIKPINVLKKVQKADDRDKLLIFGWIRDIESILKLVNIPMPITYLVLIYFTEGEYFAEARKDHFKITEEGLKITNIKFCSIYEHSIYMYKWIKSNTNNIWQWRFEIDGEDKNVSTSDEPFASIYFGLVSKADKVIPAPSDTAITAIPNYGISNRGHRYENCVGEYSKIRDEKWHFNNGDTVKFILDLTCSTWSFQINDDPILEIFNTIIQSDDVRYKFALQLTVKGIYMRLVDFRVTYK